MNDDSKLKKCLLFRDENHFLLLRCKIYKLKKKLIVMEVDYLFYLIDLKIDIFVFVNIINNYLTYVNIKIIF